MKRPKEWRPRQGRLRSRPRCPKCGSDLDGWSEVGHGQKPSAGDVSVCSYCAEVLIYTATLGLRRPTEAEYIDCMTDKDVQTIVAAVLTMPLYGKPHR